MKTATKKEPKNEAVSFALGMKLVKANEVKKIVDALDNMNLFLIEQIRDEKDENKIQELLTIKNDVVDAKTVSLKRQSISDSIKMLNDPNVRPEIQISVATSSNVITHTEKDARTTANLLRNLLRQTDKELTELFNKLKDKV